MMLKLKCYLFVDTRKLFSIILEINNGKKLSILSKTSV